MYPRKRSAVNLLFINLIELALLRPMQSVRRFRLVRRRFTIATSLASFPRRACNPR
jgi:hypothetical protein